MSVNDFPQMGAQIDGNVDLVEMAQRNDELAREEHERYDRELTCWYRKRAFEARKAARNR